tara:strand:+ start:103 stop:273 length:171 start_codon:yes stop_codon:yes gene_type:complete
VDAVKALLEAQVTVATVELLEDVELPLSFLLQEMRNKSRETIKMRKSLRCFRKCCM